MKMYIDEPCQLVAARSIRRQLRALAQHMKGARQAEDIESIHQVRVASRRLRTALRVFRDCFPAKKARKWSRQICRMTRDLGEARDRDVQIEFLDAVLSNLTEKQYRAGIARLRLRLAQRRQALQGKVIKALDRLKESNALEEMKTAVERSLADLKGREIPGPSPFAYRLAREHILRGLGRLLALEDCLANPDDRQRHHQMRIEAKRLRYTLEICKPFYARRINRTIGRIRRLQTLLGDVHDTDVWIDQLQAFPEEERKRALEYFGHDRSLPPLTRGIEHLQHQRQAHRKRVFTQLARTWRKLTEGGLWRDLTATVQSCVQPLEHPPVAPGQTPVPEDANP